MLSYNHRNTNTEEGMKIKPNLQSGMIFFKNIWIALEDEFFRVQVHVRKTYQYISKLEVAAALAAYLLASSWALTMFFLYLILLLPNQLFTCETVILHLLANSSLASSDAINENPSFKIRYALLGILFFEKFQIFY